MATQVKWKTVGIGLGAAAVIALGGSWAANAAGLFDRPAPEPTAVIQEAPSSTPTPSVTPTPTPTPTPEAVVEAPPVVEEAPVESGPDLCPPGTQANSSDGYNDLTCFPDSCYVGPVSNETHPECITAMPPYYYR